MWKWYNILALLLWGGQLRGQSNYFELDTLSNNDLKLEVINFRYGHTYRFTTTIERDSVFLILPKGLPKGYYEAYYHNDTNRLALVYYKNGARTYGQQFYADGSMKSDTEYSSTGDFHGLHTIYDRKGEELWHAEYNFGTLDAKYDLAYLSIDNKTDTLLKNKQAFGIYEFLPTPSRGRRERIHLNEDGTFVYENSIHNCHFCHRYEGNWRTLKNFVLLELKGADVWRMPVRQFAITATARLTQLELIEVKKWGVEWYNSEYRKISK